MLKPRWLCFLSLFVTSVSAPLVANDQAGMGELLFDTAASADGVAATEGDTARLEARGVLRPGAEAVLSSQIAARVVAIPFKEGETFAAGDTLVKLDCNFYEAQLSAAQAAAAAARIQLESDQQLARLNSIGTLEVQLSEARLRQAEAEVKLNQVLTDRCVIRAPYAGRVVERMIQPHESVTQDTRLLSLVAQSVPEIRLVVPSTWLAWLRPGIAFQFRIDETGAVLPATVSAIGARIDAVSQTLPVTARFKGKADGLTPGMSGTARFEASSQAKVH